MRSGSWHRRAAFEDEKQEVKFLQQDCGHEVMLQYDLPHIFFLHTQCVIVTMSCLVRSGRADGLRSVMEPESLKAVQSTLTVFLLNGIDGSHYGY